MESVSLNFSVEFVYKNAQTTDVALTGYFLTMTIIFAILAIAITAGLLLFIRHKKLHV